MKFAIDIHLLLQNSYFAGRTINNFRDSFSHENVLTSVVISNNVESSLIGNKTPTEKTIFIKFMIILFSPSLCNDICSYVMLQIFLS